MQFYVITIIAFISVEISNSFDLSFSKTNKIARSNEAIYKTSTPRMITYGYNARLDEENKRFDHLTISSEINSKNGATIYFDYRNTTIYDKYSLHIRYHGGKGSYSKFFTLSLNETNKVQLSKFPKSYYIVCLALYPRDNFQNEYEPLRSNDMCIDLAIGKDKLTLHEKHSKMGFLGLGLLAIAAVLLLLISTIYKIKRSHLIYVIDKKRGRYSLSNEQQLLTFATLTSFKSSSEFTNSIFTLDKNIKQF
jgi:hypothetical protein